MSENKNNTINLRISKKKIYVVSRLSQIILYDK